MAILAVSLLRGEIGLTEILSREYENNPDDLFESLLETREGASIEIGTPRGVKPLGVI